VNTLNNKITGFFNKLTNYSIYTCINLSLCLWTNTAQAECIGVITAGGGQDFWQQIANGAIQAGKDLNYPVIVRGPVNESDNKNQLLIMEKMLDTGCKALVMAPNSNEHIEKIETLSKAGIPIVYIDRDIGGPGISIVATDNFNAGVLAGEEMIRQLGTSGKIAVLRFSEHLNSTSEREQGFINTIKKSPLQITLDEYVGTDLAIASENAYALLSQHTEIQGLFTPNEISSLAALNMRKRVAGGNKIIHIGFDTHPRLLTAIEAGEMQAIIIQNPFQIGYLGVKQAMEAMQGNNTIRVIRTPFLLVNAKNIDSDEVKQTLHKQAVKVNAATNRLTEPLPSQP
jgi:ribose transport system substrate-binding protein